MFFLQEKTTKQVSIENQCKSKKKIKKQFPLKINENQKWEIDNLDLLGVAYM